MLVAGAGGARVNMVGSGRAFSYEVDGMSMDDYISYSDYSRQTISATVSTFRKYVLTTRVFNHQDWSSAFNCWVSRPGCAARSRTLFKGGVRQVRCHAYEEALLSGDSFPPLPTCYER